MKAQKLFSCQFGSRLYGTQTPTSDIDWKHVVLPSLDDLLLCHKIENKVKKTNTEKNVRNTADDVDEEFIPLQVFARHFVEGQTYALELAFALEGTHAEQTLWCFSLDNNEHDQLPYRSRVGEHYFSTFVKELRKQFLTSNIKAMMGYVVNQASLYSFKGERLNATRDLYSLLYAADEYYKDDDTTTAVIDQAPIWRARFDELAAKYPKYIKRDVYDIGGDRMKPCFLILEKTLPHTNTLPHSMKVLETLMKKYGSRADQASESNVDWKATMHALRIVDEGLELLEHHKLSFPFKQDYVDHLLAIKRGELPLDPIKDELSQKLDKLKELEKSTDLPECNAEFKQKFEEWLLNWMRFFYGV